MSTEEATQKQNIFANWQEYPFEVKIMDLASIAWLAVAIIEIVFYAIRVETNMRVFPIIVLPFFMLVVTLSLRLRLVEKPETIRNVFITWAVIFLVYLLGAVLVLALYPPLI